MFLNPTKVVLKALDVVDDAVNGSTKKHISNNKLTTNKIWGAVAALGIGAATFIARSNATTEIDAKNGTIKTIRDKSVAHAMIEAGFVPSLDSARVDTQSFWKKSLNQGALQFGANMIDNQTGDSHHVQYFLKPVGNKEYDVFESVDDGLWEHKGHVDKKRMHRMEDLSSEMAGGPVFGYLAQLAKNVT